MERSSVLDGLGCITGISPDPRHPAAVRVSLDGKITWTVSRRAVDRIGVAAGMVLDEPLREALALAADEEATWRAILRHLERRPFARGDLGRRLRLRAHPPAAVEAALARAEDAGLLDDLKFARSYAETRAQRGRGPARLRADLSQLRVASAIVDQVIAELWPDGEGVDEMVRALASKRVGQLEGLPREVRRRRVLAYLARRGFSGPRTRHVVMELTG
ncbi:MAG: regulatory protein RecX [Gemmatimonadales bacterium]